MKTRPIPAIGIWLIALAGGAPAPGQVAATPSGGTDFSVALRSTIEQGRPTLVVVTSAAEPASLATLAAAGPLAVDFTLVELSAERDAERVASLKIRRYPTVLIYGREGSGLKLLGHREGPLDGAALWSWVGRLGLTTPSTDPAGVRAEAPPIDPAVEPAGLFGHGHDRMLATPQASPQQPFAPPKTSPPQLAPPPPAPPLMAPPQMSTVIAPAPAAPVILQQPQQAIYVQPSAPQILIGQAPPPQITLIQGPQAAPTVSVAYATATPTPGVPAQSPPNLFMSPPQQTPPPQQGFPSPQGPYCPPPQQAVPQLSPPPQQGVPQMAQPMAGLAQPQQSIVGATALALILENPGVIDTIISGFGRGLRGLGDLLARRGGPRLRMAPPAMASPAAGVPSAFGFAMPLQAVALPQAQAVPEYLAVPNPPAPPAPCPTGSAPSPQCAPGGDPNYAGRGIGPKHGLFGGWRR